MKWFVAIGSFVLLAACAGKDSEPDDRESTDERVERKCREFISGLCSQYVRCGVEQSNGEPITDAVCEAVLPDLVADCMQSSSEDLASTTDAELDPCITAIENQACELVCNRVPEDPPECLALDGYDPQTMSTTCPML